MPARLLKVLSICLGFALMLGACSRIDLAYRNLDRLVPWSLGDYLDMNREQKTLLDDRLKQHLAWHCQTQLPGYLDWLDRLRTMWPITKSPTRRCSSAPRRPARRLAGSRPKSRRRPPSCCKA